MIQRIGMSLEYEVGKNSNLVFIASVVLLSHRWLQWKEIQVRAFLFQNTKTSLA